MSKWIIDPDHTVAAFSIRHLMVVYVHGQFNKIDGVIEFDPDDILNLSIELGIDVSSIMTGVSKRDAHLRSGDFFDESKYPKITFKSSKAEIIGFNIYKITGDLTIHGLKRIVALNVNLSGPVSSPYGETVIGLIGKTSINREDFGVNWNQPLENGGYMVGKDVEIMMNVEADLSG